MLARAIRIVTLLALLLAWVSTLARVHELAQERFFTIDEYQFAHATWLVSEGERPYVDFYEHHFPASYVLHAPVLWPDGSFRDKALRLRTLSFAYALGLSILLVVASWRVTRDAGTALLCGTLPLAVGFGLMSLVDYRADSFAACLIAAALALLEANRRGARRAPAWIAGGLLALAVAMTQKAVYFGVGPVAVLWAFDRVRSRRADPGVAFVARPGHVAAAAAAVGGAGLAAAAATGVLAQGFELTVLQAVRHEAVYPDVPVSRWVVPVVQALPVSSAALVGLAAVSFLTRDGRFWLVALGSALAATALVTARYPYNYVLVCLLLGLCAARGAGELVRRLPLGSGRGAALRPALLLLPLIAVVAQLRFVDGTTSNAHQLELLERIERFGGEDDAVIDNAGGAIFRPHASYYWYQGGAQRSMYADYFETRLAEDYRRSRALFRIRDLRQRWLPAPVRDHLAEHYVRIDGDLFGLGYRTGRTRESGRSFEIDVLRSDEYYVLPSDPASGEWSGPAAGLRIDGVPVEGDRVHLEAGRHRLSVPPGSPALLVTPLPPEAFARTLGDRVHSPLFEYRRRARELRRERAGT